MVEGSTQVVDGITHDQYPVFNRRRGRKPYDPVARSGGQFISPLDLRRRGFPDRLYSSKDVVSMSIPPVQLKFHSPSAPASHSCPLEPLRLQYSRVSPYPRGSATKSGI